MSRKIRTEAVDSLFDAVLSLKSREECYTFFEDVCTINELLSLSQRFEVAKMLRDQKTYLEIAEKTGASTATISRVTARAQVQAHQNAPGYFTCYYYGMKKICDWEKQYGYTKWDYTELLFSAGRISMESLEMLVKMTKEEQGRFFTEFRSLLME